jgi:sulfur carrier protein ThiS adenylyltransferase
VRALRENILAIDPEVVIEACDLRIDAANALAVFGDADVLVEAFDRAEEKAMLVQAMMENRPEMPVVSASGLAGIGGNNRIRTKRYGRLYVCGDGESAVSADNPPLAPRVGVVANMQANQVLEILWKRAGR